jgi:hypothetical protein
MPHLNALGEAGQLANRLSGEYCKNGFLLNSRKRSGSLKGGKMFPDGAEVALYLSAIYQITGDINLQQTLRNIVMDAENYLTTQQRTDVVNDWSLYHGKSAWLWTIAEVRNCLNDEWAPNALLRELKPAILSFVQSKFINNGLFCGRAGLLITLLRFYKDYKSEIARELAYTTGEMLLHESLSAIASNRAFTRLDLESGSCGIALALLECSELFQSNILKKAAIELLIHLPIDPTTNDQFMAPDSNNSWAHGDLGRSIVSYRAFQLTNDYRLRQRAKRLLETVSPQIESLVDLCAMDILRIRAKDLFDPSQLASVEQLSIPSHDDPQREAIFNDEILLMSIRNGFHLSSCISRLICPEVSAIPNFVDSYQGSVIDPFQLPHLRSCFPLTLDFIKDKIPLEIAEKTPLHSFAETIREHATNQEFGWRVEVLLSFEEKKHSFITSHIQNTRIQMDVIANGRRVLAQADAMRVALEVSSATATSMMFVHDNKKLDLAIPRQPIELQELMHIYSKELYMVAPNNQGQYETVLLNPFQALLLNEFCNHTNPTCIESAVDNILSLLDSLHIEIKKAILGSWITDEFFHSFLHERLTQIAKDFVMVGVLVSAPDVGVTPTVRACPF